MHPIVRWRPHATTTESNRFQPRLLRLLQCRAARSTSEGAVNTNAQVYTHNYSRWRYSGLFEMRGSLGVDAYPANRHPTRLIQSG